MTLTLAVSHPAWFGIATLQDADKHEAQACTCAKCGRENVPTPNEFVHEIVWCLYCGMEHGYVPMVEMQGTHHKRTYGMTLEEVRADTKALDEGRFDEHCDAMARKYNRVFDDWLCLGP